ncbi:uncharacterized protein LOC111701573 [Eurytemora carolleeae]|uniref:uncharacterized protein LOC111701573 n=1 Tax=Eurytemora carolleeae TaxID=1294199 RepID=UPI000C77BF45|nr:uncharacterized protein LOC111701573 [Eurytemora carolleeae]|eukprot:XP_023328686.1 uncharacterized protein LOC111701573 [Eurytemora affinis]
MYDGMVYITLITGFSVLYNVNKMLELETVVATTSVSNVNEFGENITQIFEEIVLQPTPLRESEFYTKYIVFLLNFLVMGLLPVILLSVLNFCIYRSIAKATRNHNNISSDIRYQISS